MISAVAVAAAAVTVLTACQSRVGTAAYVGKTKISESTVQSYLTQNAVAYQVQSQDQSTGQTTTSIVNPKNQVLSTLIADDLFQRTLSSSKQGPATASELSTARAAYLQQVGAPESALIQNIAQRGFRASFEDLFVRTQSLFSVLASRLNSSTGSEVVAEVKAMGVTVKANPRYGAWDAAQLGLAQTVPSYLTSVPLVSNG